MTENFIFSKSPGQIYVEWKIQNIFERCRKKDFLLNSPLFSLCCSKWHLMACVRPKSNLPFSGWLDLYLIKETYSKKHRISCRMGIKKAGKEVKSFDFECRSGSEENTWGMTDFIELKEDFNVQKSAEAPGSIFATTVPGPIFAATTPSSIFATAAPGPTFATTTPSSIFATAAPGPIFAAATPSSKFATAAPGLTFAATGRKKNYTVFGGTRIPESQSVSNLLTADFTSHISLTVFCTASLQDVTTFPSLISLNEGETFSKNIKDLYINKRYTDVKIEVKDKEFLAHKCILAARSAVFASMFDHDMAEKSTGNVKITDCDPDSFQEFLIFLYTGKLDVVSSNNAMNLYKTADKYNLEELMKECVRCMVRELSVDSFCDVLHFATVHDETDLLTAARNFFNDNVKNILPTLKWHNLMEEYPSLCNELFIKFVDK